MGGTTITYNGIVIQDVLTQDVSQEVEYDSTGVDPIYIKTSIVSRFIFHTATGDGLGYRVGSSDLAGGIQAALRQLIVPRRQYTMTIGGNVFVDIAPSAIAPNVKQALSGRPGVDLNNGPKPKLVIEEIVGTKTARGTLTVDLALPLIETGEWAAKDQIINLRFWTADEVDANWLTTRTIRGRIRVTNQHVNLHQLRNLLFPPVQAGFRRKTMNFAEDPNGLVMDFTITDEEVHATAPKPATSWSGTHMVSSPYAGGAVAEEEVRVTLEGAHDTPQAKLVRLAVQILDSKLHLSTRINNDGSTESAVLLYMAVSAALEKNRVEAVAKIKHTGSASGELRLVPILNSDSFAQYLPTDVTDEGYDPYRSRVLRGPTASLSTIFVASLQLPHDHAILPTHKFGDESGGDAKPEAEVGEDVPKPETAVIPLLPTYKFDTEHRKYPYLYYRTMSVLHTNSGSVVLPGANVDSESTTQLLAIVDLTQPVTIRTITLKGQRVGKPPEFPKPKPLYTDENGIGHVLLSSVIQPSAGLLVEDSNATWYTASVQYEYALERAQVPGTDTISLSKVPYVTDGWLPGSLPPEMFVDENP